MSLLTKKKFSFTSSAKGLTQDEFTVTSFKGSEAISKPYEFEIMLVSDNMNIDPAKVVQNPAKFTIHREGGGGGDVDFNGILAQFEELREFNGHIFFRALLVPKLWWLSLTHHNQVCLNNSVSEIIENTLKDGGLLQNLDFDFKMQNNYPKFDYVCQYGETHFNFISRWAEREGIYYFFEQTENGEKVVFTDTKIAHSDLPQEATLYYSPPTGLDFDYLSEIVRSFTCRHQMLPRKVFLKDYNYERPSLGIEGSAVVDKNGRGEKYIYGEYFPSPEEGNRLANIRAEELLCRKVQFFGESAVPFMMPGYTFKMKDHYRSPYNSRYLITEVTHEGHQTGYLYSGIQEGLSEQEQQMHYQNSFSAIPADVQFRPEKISEKPKVSGTLHARVDAAGDGQYAELDDQGRYKIKLPFDVNSDHKDGKASAYVRMMQPSAGENQGMHFPLHSRTEVLLTFIDGDPDRPVIAGAVPNPETASPVTGANQTTSVISTGKGPETHSVGAEYVKSKEKQADYASTVDNYIEFKDDDKEHIRINSIGDLWLEANKRYGDYHVGKPDGTPTSPPSAPTGLRLTQDTQTISTPPPPPKIGDMLAKFGSSTGSFYNPSGLIPRHGSATTQTFDEAFAQGHVHVSSFDTVNTQEGNIYDFGGYWVYNLGNCYVENHVAQKTPNTTSRLAKLNDKPGDYDMLDVGGPNWVDFKRVGNKRDTTSVPPPKVDPQASSNELDEYGTDKVDKVKYGSWGNGKVLVEKKFDSSSYGYNYYAHSIEVNEHCSTHDINISGRHIEEKYSGTGYKTLHSVSESGRKEEQKFDRFNGLKIFDGLSWKEGEVGKKETVVHDQETKWARNSGNKISYSEIKDEGTKIITKSNKYHLGQNGRPVSESTVTDNGSSLVTEERKYNRDWPYGEVSYSHTTDNGARIHNFKTNFHTTATFTLDAGNIAGINARVGFNNNFKFDFNHGVLNVDFKWYVGLNADVKAGGGLGYEGDLRVAGVLKHIGVTKFKFEGVGFCAKKDKSVALLKEDVKILQNKIAATDNAIIFLMTKGSFTL